MMCFDDLNLVRTCMKLDISQIIDSNPKEAFYTKQSFDLEEPIKANENKAIFKIMMDP